MTCSPWSPLADWISSLKKHMIRKWIEPPKPLGPCLKTVWGILQAISGKPEIWQKSFRDASPGFYGQVAKPTLAWATWLELPGQAKPTWLCLTKSEFLWRQAAPFMGFVFMNLAISSKNGTFCFGAPRKWMIMVPTPGILPGSPEWESKHSLFIQNRKDGIKSTASSHNW